MTWRLGATLAAPLLAAGLGCAGLMVKSAELAQVEAAVRSASPTTRIPLLLSGAGDAGLVLPPCGKMLGAIVNADPSQRATLLAAALGEVTSLCPSTCGGDGVLDDLVALSPEERIAGVLAKCDAEGPDPVFGGPLAPLRTGASPLDYLVVRAVAERATAAAPSFADVLDNLAVDLALTGAGPLTATDQLAVTGTRDVDPAVFLGLGDALRACTEHGQLRHRLVVDPNGAVVAVERVWSMEDPSPGPDNPCVVGLLDGLTLPAADAWSWIDVAWAVPERAEAPTN